MNRDSTADGRDGTAAETVVGGPVHNSTMIKTFAENFKNARASLDSFEFIPNQQNSLNVTTFGPNR